MNLVVRVPLKSLRAKDIPARIWANASKRFAGLDNNGGEAAEIWSPTSGQATNQPPCCNRADPNSTGNPLVLVEDRKDTTDVDSWTKTKNHVDPWRERGRAGVKLQPEPIGIYDRRVTNVSVQVGISGSIADRIPLQPPPEPGV